MARNHEYIINSGAKDERTITADGYGLSDGYFHFTEGSSKRVFSIHAQGVTTVELKDDKK